MVLAQSHALLALHVKFSTGSLMFMISTCSVYMYSSCTPLISCFALLLADMHHAPALHCSHYPSNNTNTCSLAIFLAMHDSSYWFMLVLVGCALRLASSIILCFLLTCPLVQMDTHSFPCLGSESILKLKLTSNQLIIHPLMGMTWQRGFIFHTCLPSLVKKKQGWAAAWRSRFPLRSHLAAATVSLLRYHVIPLLCIYSL